jgi:hypothetical protein
MEIQDSYLTLREVSESLGDLSEKLAGPNGAYWLTGLKMFLRKENPWPAKPFAIWGTIKIKPVANIGLITYNLKKKDEIFQGISYLDIPYHSFEVDAEVVALIKQNRFELYKGEEEKEREIKLTAVSAADLGFKNNYFSYEDLWARAEWVGLKLCPQETAFYIYNQKKGNDFKYLYVASEPISINDIGGKAILVGCDGVVHRDMRWAGLLRLSEISTKKENWPDWKFLFCLPD